MSRGGRGGGRGGRSSFTTASLQAMGLTYADIQSMSREQTELYPAMDSLPVLTAPTEEERKICELQNGFVERLRGSKYYLVEVVKGDELPRYSDKYRPSPAAQPTLKRKDLHQPFFPQEIFEDYFNPGRRKKGKNKKEKKRATKRVRLDEIAAGEGEEEQEPASDKPTSELSEASDAGSQAEEEEEDDVDDELGENDYVENYFDNGEGDDLDDLGDGGGGGGDGGGGDYD